MWLFFLVNLEKQSKDVIPDVFLKKLRIRLQDQHAQLFHSSLYNDNVINGSGAKLRTYRNFKVNYVKEKYLSCIRSFKYRKALSKIRLSSHALRIEVGRYNHELVEERICEFCDSGPIESEEHFLLHCPLYRDERNHLISTLSLSAQEFSLNLFFSPDCEVAVPVGKCVYNMYQKRKRKLLDK